jgi:hypothetical protein
VSARTVRHTLATLACLVWLGFIVRGLQQVQSPQPLAMLALMLAWLAVFSLAAAGPGLALWAWGAGRPPRGWTEIPVVLALGAAVLAAGPVLLGLAGVLRPVPLLLVLGACAGWGAWQVARTPVPGVPRRWPGSAAAVPAGLVAVFGGLALVVALTEAPFYDQLHYHLAFPFHWLRQGTIFVLPRHLFSYLAGTMSLIYCYPLAGLGAWAAQGLSWWMGAVAVGACAGLGRIVAGPRAVWWGAAMLACSPVMATSATWAVADLGAAAWGATAALAVVLGSREPSERRWRVIALAGGLAGAAAGAKILALVTVVAPVGVLAVLMAPEAWRRRWRTALVFGAGVALTLGGWLVRNTVTSGYPLYPFSTVGAVPGLASAVDGGQPPRVLKGSLKLTFSKLGHVLALDAAADDNDAGVLGPAVAILLLPALLLAIRRRSRTVGALLAAGVVGLLGWGAGPLLGRYAAPVLVLVAVPAAWAWTGLRTMLSRGLRRPADWALAGLLVWTGLGLLTPIQSERLACSLGAASPGELMRRNVSCWNAITFVNRELPPAARILMVAEARGLHLDRDLLIEDPFQPPLLVELANRATGTAALAAELKRRGVTHVLVNWHEAARMAVLQGRDDYFGDLSPAGRQRMMELRRDFMQRVLEEGPVEVLTWR